MASIVVALTSSPETPAGRRALALAESLAGQGHALTVCCLEDAVLLGSDRAAADARATLGRLLDRGARCVVLADDLALRGLRQDGSAVAVDHAGLVAILTADHDRALGAF